jgi:hypothetical protein
MIPQSQSPRLTKSLRLFEAKAPQKETQHEEF